MMGEIIVNNMKILFDDCDSDFVQKNKWSLRLGWKKSPYAFCKEGLMHRLIMECPKGLLVDHKNHDTLDNRRENLRICTRSQNMWNRKRTCGASKYKGIIKRGNRWRTQVYLNDKRVYSAYFGTEEEAALAYNKKAIELYGEFACLNIIGEQ